VSFSSEPDAWKLEAGYFNYREHVQEDPNLEMLTFSSDTELYDHEV